MRKSRDQGVWVLLLLLAGLSWPAFAADPGPTAYDVSISGNGFFGERLAVGDFNGDGLQDLLVGAFQASHNGLAGAGKAYVFLGQKAWSANSSASKADVTILGGARFDHLGFGVAVGDLNRDGFDDIIVGTAANKVYVIWGRSQLPKLVDVRHDDQDLTVVENAGIGEIMTVGDINRDGFLDLLLSAPYDDGPSDERDGRTSLLNDSGAVYILFGKSAWPSTIDLGQDEQDVTIYGKQINDSLGIALAIADFNNDKIADFAIGSDVGSYIFFGRSHWPKVIDLATENADILLRDISTFTLKAGDFNGDGQADLYWADPNFGTRPGGCCPSAAYIMFGDGNWADEVVSVQGSDVSIVGPESESNLGLRSVIGDLNGDGIDDLIVRFSRNDRAESVLYSLYGQATWPRWITPTSTPADRLIVGSNAMNSPTNNLGTALAIGDLNGDGLKDVIAGASGAYNGASVQDGVSEGKVLIYFGGSAAARGLGAPSKLRVRLLKSQTQAPGVLVPVRAMRMELRWTDKSNNETGFLIERKVGKTGTWEQLGSTVANVARFFDTNVEAGLTYCYRVKAINPSEESGYSNEACKSLRAVRGRAMATKSEMRVTLYDLRGRLGWRGSMDSRTSSRVLAKIPSDLANGVYFYMAGPEVRKLVVLR